MNFFVLLNYLKINSFKFKLILLNFVSTLQFETGNFPSSVTGGSDTKVHFFHDPIGAIHLYGLASEIFSDINYLKIAEKCSISIWERGLLLKGNCVCHGISGSVYGMYKLYQLTKKKTIFLNLTCSLKGHMIPMCKIK